MDHHVPRPVTSALRTRGVDVITAFEDNASDWDDRTLLDRATGLGRVLVTQDRDFIVEAIRRQNEGISFSGVIYAHQLRVSIRTFIEDLELVANAEDVEQLANRLIYLPL